MAVHSLVFTSPFLPVFSSISDGFWQLLNPEQTQETDETYNSWYESLKKSWAWSIPHIIYKIIKETCRQPENQVSVLQAKRERHALKASNWFLCRSFTRHVGLSLTWLTGIHRKSDAMFMRTCGEMCDCVFTWKLVFSSDAPASTSNLHTACCFSEAALCKAVSPLHTHIR